MPAKSISFGCSTVLGVLTLLIASVNSLASGPAEKVFHKFTGPPDGENPQGALVADANGNLYGTAVFGGSCTVSVKGCGIVFELSPPAVPGGDWTETILYSFTGGSDGAAPSGTLIFDKQGNLYGTRDGGIFELSPPATEGGAWTETNLPSPGNLQGSKLLYYGGDFYGVTQDGGSAKLGTAFVLKPPATAGGEWSYRVLHNFGVVQGDGSVPVAGLVVHNGALYGTTTQGGGVQDDGYGIVFELTLKNGVWTETVLYDFTTSAGFGVYPVGSLIFDTAGNIYGVTSQGTLAFPNPGAVYELSPPATSGDPWQETTLYNFGSHAKDGDTPMAGLIRDPANNLYGTTYYGGTGTLFGNGIVFKLKPPQTSGGAWTEVILHYFDGVANGDGVHPAGELIQINSQGFYGTTTDGGVHVSTEFTGGVVFNLVQ
jgi:hypothetical protein